MNSPFDAEVLEGYQSMQKNKNPDYYIDQVKAGLGDIVGPAKTFEINYKLIAASLVGIFGLVGVGYLVSSIDFSSDPEIAQAEVEEVKEAPNPVNTIEKAAEVVVVDSVVTEQEEIASEPEAVEIEQEEIVEAPALVAIEPSEVEEEETLAFSETADVSSEDVEMDALENLVTARSTEATSTASDPTPDMESYAKSTAPSPKVSKKHENKAAKEGFTDASELRSEKSLMDEAGVRFKKKQYADAAKFYDLVLNSSPNNQEALAYGGLSNLYIGNYSKSANQLSQVARKTDNVKWSLATAYLKTGRKESAKSILNDLATNGSSVYKKKANSVLESL